MNAKNYLQKKTRDENMASCENESKNQFSSADTISISKEKQPNGDAVLNTYKKNSRPWTRRIKLSLEKITTVKSVLIRLGLP